jgi:hypothetical protein
MPLHDFFPDRFAPWRAYSDDGGCRKQSGNAPVQKHGTPGAMQAARQLFEA